MYDETRADIVAGADAVCEIVRTTLGPFGANKLVVQDSGSVTTTAVGSTVLERLDVDDPSVTLLRAATEGFEARYGDGTSTVAAIAGALSGQADDLVEQGLHPTAIERGYRDAATVALDALDRSARPLSDYGIAPAVRTALTGTRDPYARTTVSEYLEDVVEQLGAEEFGLENVKVQARLGGSRSETELVYGVVVEREPVLEGMPQSFDDTGVALLSDTVDVPRFGGENRGLGQGKIKISGGSYEDRVELAERERETFREQLQAASEAGARVLLTGRAINERVERDIANAGMLACQRIDDEDLRLIARATGGEVVSDLREITPEVLGRGDVGIRRKAGRDMLVVESEAGEPTHTLFCRAPDPRAVDAFQHSVESALTAAEFALEEGAVVPGGGATEMRANHAVREHARSVSGPEQLAVEAFADALRVVPRTLATNAGMDGWDAVLRLHVAHDERRDATGIDCLGGEVTDVLADEPIVDPLPLKRATWESATDLAIKLVRIDDRLEAIDLEPDPEEEMRPDRPRPENV